jgi:hypothetical protein
VFLLFRSRSTPLSAWFQISDSSSPTNKNQDSLIVLLRLLRVWVPPAQNSRGSESGTASRLTTAISSSWCALRWMWRNPRSRTGFDRFHPSTERGKTPSFSHSSCSIYARQPVASSPPELCRLRVWPSTRGRDPEEQWHGSEPTSPPILTGKAH